MIQPLSKLAAQLTACLLFACSGASLAAEKSMRPAHFSESNASLQNRIKFPKTDEDISLTIPCHTVVSDRGVIDTILCFSDEGLNNDFVHAITRNGFSTIEPAIYNGFREPVFFLFSVHFAKNGEKETITVFPNHATNVDELGLDYSAAQSLSGDNLGRNNRRAAAACIGEGVIWVESFIDSTGKAISSEIVSDVEKAGCRGKLTQYVINMSYVPAFSDGKPVGSIFRRPYWFRR